MVGINAIYRQFITVAHRPKARKNILAFVGNLQLFTLYDFLERDFFTPLFSLGGLLGVGLLFGIGGRFRLLLRLLFRLLFRDLGLQNAYMILKASELGLDTLIMGIRDSAALRAELNIPENEEIAAVIAVGYRKTEPHFNPRKDLDEILKFF